MSSTWHTGPDPGTTVPLALVKIDVEGATRLREMLDRKKLQRLLEAYHRVVEAAARAVGAGPDPLWWAGDGTALYVGGERAAALAVGAAINILDQLRVLPEGRIHVRIGIGFDDVRYRQDLGRIEAEEFDFGGHLEHVCPKDAVLITEETYRALAHEPHLAGQFHYFGMRKDDRCPAYVAPEDSTRADAKHRDELVPEGEDSFAAREALLRLYRDPGFRRIRFVGVRQFEHVVSVDIPSVFQPCRLRPWRARADRREAATQERPSPDEARRDRPIGTDGAAYLAAVPFYGDRPRDLREVLACHQRLVVLGDPGSGKSTLLRYLAIVAAEGRRRLRQAVGVDERRLPLHFSLGRLAPIVAAAGNLAPSAVLASYYEGLGVTGAERVIREVLEGPGLLLFDGLDEVTSDAERRHLERFLEGLLNLHPRPRAVLTSRVVGYVQLSLAGCETFTLEPLDEDAARSIARALYVALHRLDLGEDEEQARRRGAQEADSLLDAFRHRPALRHFSENPLLLTLSALVHVQVGRLPRYRVLLYRLTVQTLIEAWARMRLAAQPLHPVPTVAYEVEGLAVFPPLALRLHREDSGGLIAEEDLISFIADRLPHAGPGHETGREDAARVFLRRIAQAGAILIEKGPGRWGFLHQTLQEYLAAKHLAGDDRLRTRLLHDHLYDPRYEDVWRLVAGEMGVGQERPPAATAFVRAVLSDGDRLHARLLRKNVLLAARCLADTAVDDPRLVERVLREVVDMTLAPRVVPPWVEVSKLLAELGGTAEGVVLRARFIDVLRAQLIEVFAGAGQLRIWAAAALGALGDRESIPALQEALREDPVDGVRFQASESLRWLRAREAVADAIHILEREDSYPVLEAAARMLIDLPTADARTLLVRWFREATRIDVAATFAQALLRLGDDELVLQALREGGENAGDAASAALALGREGRRESVPALLEVLETNQDPHLEEYILEALGHLGDDRVVPAILSRLGAARDLDVRIAAAMSLGQLRASEARLLLRQIALGTVEHASLRATAIQSLAAIGDTALSEDLCRIAAGDGDWNIRAAAAAALGAMRAREAAPRLCRLLGDPDLWVATAAAQALAWLGDARAVDGVVRLVRRVARRAAESPTQVGLALWDLGLLPPHRSKRVKDRPTRQRPKPSRKPSRRAKG